MAETFLIAEKINEVKAEMKRTGIWENETPAWVNEFEKININNGADFNEWLQFVFLPNRMQETTNNAWIIDKTYIVPQAVKFFGSDIKKGKLLQLLIELDAL
jgi:uncharacterized protein YqcC (DUF446 family)